MSIKSMFLISFIFIFSFNFSKADHVMGAEIQWTNIGKDTFLITVRVYRDCNGVSLSASDITVTTTCGKKTLKTSAIRIDDVTPVCSSEKSRCASSTSAFKYGIELYELYSTFIVTDFRKNGCCEAILTWSQCCRNNSITTGGANKGLFVDAKMNICSDFSSPTWNSPTIAIGCLGRDQVLDNGVDNSNSFDSLVYTCSDPRSSVSSLLSYKYPYSACSPLSYYGFPRPNLAFPRGFHIDSLTGETAFRPMAVEHTVMGILIELYHKGKYMGYMFRDMEYIVIKCPNNEPPALSGINFKTPSPKNFSITTCAGKNVCFKLTASDPNTNDTVVLRKLGAPTTASISIKHQGGQYDTAFVCWKPDSTKIRNNPYNFTFLAEDNACPTLGRNVAAYSIYVVDTFTYELIINIDTLNNCGLYKLGIVDKTGKKIQNVKWYENDSIFIGKENNLEYNFTTKGNKKITAIVDDCKTQLKSTYLDVKTINPLSLDFKDSVYCAVTPITIKPTISGSHGLVTFNWSVDNNFGYNGKLNTDSIVLNLPLLKTFTSGMVELIITDSIGCMLKKQKLITSKTNTILNIENSKSFCGYDNNIIVLGLNNGQGNWNGPGVEGNILDLDSLKTGSYLLIFSDEQEKTCITDTAIISLSSIPKVSAGLNFNACIKGENIKLNPTPIGGNWTGIGINSSNEFDAQSAGKGTHLLIYTYIDSFGCANSDTTLVTVFDYTPIINVQDSAKACENEQVISLRAKPKGGTWIGQGIYSTDNELIITPKDFGSGNFDIIYYYIDSNNCSNSDTANISILEVPKSAFSLNKSKTIIGDTLRITNNTTSNGSTSYLWLIGSSAFLQSTNKHFNEKMDSLGEFDIKLIATNTITSCTDTSYLQNGAIIVLEISTNRLESNNLILYPNPANNYLQIKSTKNLIKYVSIFSADGRIIKTYNTDNNTESLDISFLKPGLYIVEIQGEFFIERQIFIKE